MYLGDSVHAAFVRLHVESKLLSGSFVVNAWDTGGLLLACMAVRTWSPPRASRKSRDHVLARVVDASFS